MFLLDQFRLFFEKHTALKRLFKPLYNVVYKNRASKKKNELFKANSLHVLSVFDDCMKKANVHYSLAFGTLLGAVREKGFIKHDLDIDVMVWEDEYSNAMRSSLEEAGFKRTRLLLVEEGKLGREETYTMEKVSIDILFIYPAVKLLPYVCIFSSYPPYPTFEISMKKLGKILPLRVEAPFERQTEYVPFESLRLPILINYDEILKAYYGETYMIPDQNWSFGQYDRNIVRWADVNAVYYKF